MSLIADVDHGFSGLLHQIERKTPSTVVHLLADGDARDGDVWQHLPQFRHVIFA